MDGQVVVIVLEVEDIPMPPTASDYKVAIVAKRLRQYEIARLLGVSEQALSKFVCGHGKLQPEQEQKLAMILGLTDHSAIPALVGDQEGL
jgi:transcriptional regulator with XRE-family HTH domain